VILIFVFFGASDLWAGGKNICWSGKNCEGRVLSKKIQHAHNCSGKSIQILDGSTGGSSKNGCYTVSKAQKLQTSMKK